MSKENVCNTLLEQEDQEIEKKVDSSPSTNLPMEKTVHVSSRTPLHDFKLNDLAWGSRKLFRTRPKISNKWTSVSKPCFKAKQCKRQTCSRPVEKVLPVVREKSMRRRKGLFSFSLRKQVIEEDFICVTGKMPERKIKVKKVYKDDDKKEFIDYQKYLKEIVPGNWMSDIYCV